MSEHQHLWGFKVPYWRNSWNTYIWSSIIHRMDYEDQTTTCHSILIFHSTCFPRIQHGGGSAVKAGTTGSIWPDALHTLLGPTHHRGGWHQSAILNRTYHSGFCILMCDLYRTMLSYGFLPFVYLTVASRLICLVFYFYSFRYVWWVSLLSSIHKVIIDLFLPHHVLFQIHVLVFI